MADQPSSREIFALTGLPPEVLAVAMAKYSRSAAPIKETIGELTEEKSADFHEKWVLGYGDASVADMAVVALAIEDVSILASKVIEDNRLASYQEKSTRYQPFSTNRYYRSAKVMASAHADRYVATMEMLFQTYQQLIDAMVGAFRQHFPKPEEMKDKAYENKLRARALDEARYALPTATLTNFGMITSARSLRHAISKLKSQPLAEMQEIGAEIQQAAIEPAYNPRAEKIGPLLAELEAKGMGDLAAQLRENMSLSVKGAPTLIKHTDPKSYLFESSRVLRELAQELLAGLGDPETGERVALHEPTDPTDDLVTTMLYSASAFSYGQIWTEVAAWDAAKKGRVIDAVTKLRGDHDWPRREYEVGQQFVFDTLMDYGAFRDLQRHRICTQINQPISTIHGYETPEQLARFKKEAPFAAAMTTAASAVAEIAKEFPNESAYLIPMAFRKRTLFKMNLREFYHMVELRSQPGGHYSYRRLVLAMADLMRAKHPLLVAGLRTQPVQYDLDFFKR